MLDVLAESMIGTFSNAEHYTVAAGMTQSKVICNNSGCTIYTKPISCKFEGLRTAVAAGEASQMPATTDDPQQQWMYNTH